MVVVVDAAGDELSAAGQAGRVRVPAADILRSARAPRERDFEKRARLPRGRAARTRESVRLP